MPKNLRQRIQERSRINAASASSDHQTVSGDDDDHEDDIVDDNKIIKVTTNTSRKKNVMEAEHCDNNDRKQPEDQIMMMTMMMSSSLVENSNRSVINNRSTSSNKDDEQHHIDNVKSQSVVSFQEPSTSSSSKSTIRNKNNIVITLIVVLLHIIAVGWYTYGFILRTTQLHNGEECQMTYSWREFFPIEVVPLTTSTAATTSRSSKRMMELYYRLYKFVDRRDLRYESQLRTVGIDPISSKFTKDGAWKDLKSLSRQEHCYGTTTTTTTKRTKTTTVSDGQNQTNDDHQEQNQEEEFDGPPQLHIVLYIPGHWGSYSQARSLGAHGIQLTRSNYPRSYGTGGSGGSRNGGNSRQYSYVDHVRTSLLTGDWDGRSNGKILTTSNNDEEHDDHGNLDKFVYEVYSVDFAEQGGALHGQFLLYQSEFVAHVIHQLVDDCFSSSSSSTTKPSITIVGHSMGGYVARLTHVLHPSIRPYIHNIITLATPHSNPLYAFDKSVYDVHQTIMMPPPTTTNGERTTTGVSTTDTTTTKLSSTSNFITTEQQKSEHDVPLIVALSGGIRDEMIEPTACKIIQDVPSSTVFSTSGSHHHEYNSFLSIHVTRLLALKERAEEGKSHSGLTTSSASLSTDHYLGMDHRAIVWCHQVLDDVRKIIWIMASTSSGTNIGNSNRDDQAILRRIKQALSLNDHVTPGDDTTDRNNENLFGQDLMNSDTKVRKKFGKLSAIAIESSMLYNLPFLLGLFLLLSSFKFASLPSMISLHRTPTASNPGFQHFISRSLCVALTTVLGILLRDVSIPLVGTILLVFVANTINVVLTIVLRYMFQSIRRRYRVQKTGRIIFMALFACGMLCLLGWVAISQLFTLREEIQWDTVAYVFVMLSTVVMLFVGHVVRPRTYCNSMPDFPSDEPEFQYFVMALLILPVALVGPLSLMVWDNTTRTSSWVVLLGVSVPVIVRSVMNCFLIHGFGLHSNQYPQIRTIVMTICTVVFSPWILARGYGYAAPYLFICVGWVDIAFGCNRNNRQLDLRSTKES